MVDLNDSDPNNLSGDKILEGLPEVDGYKILEPVVIYSRIGQGGMGSVYRGRHLGLDIDVAIKCLKSNLAEESHEFVLRFKREAKVAATINSPHLIRVFDVNESKGIHYLIMEFVRGESARERVQRKGQLGLEEAVTIVRSAAKGLAAAHAKGAVHRDIKPDNIMISTEGEVKVADLGLAKAADGLDNLETRSGMVMGTPTYMPPEQYGDVSKVGPSGDVYSLAVTLYFLLAGKHAVERGTLVEVMYRVCEGDFPDIGDVRPTMPPALSDVIAKATAKNPEDRYQTASDFARALAPFVSSDIDDEESSQAVLREEGLTGRFNKSEMLVSPPPPNTIARIKMKLSEPRVEQPTVKAARSSSPGHFLDDSAATTLSPQRTAITPVPPKKSKSSGLLLTLVVLLLLGAGGGYWWFDQQKKKPEDNNQRAENPVKESGQRPEDVVKKDNPTTIDKQPAPVKKKDEGPPKPAPVDYLKMLDQAKRDIKRYATLDAGIAKLRRIKKEAKDVIGVDKALSGALSTLSEKKENDGQLRQALALASEARGFYESEQVTNLQDRLNKKSSELLDSALSIDAPSESQVFSDMTFMLQGRINEIALNDAGFDNYMVVINDQEIPVTTGLFSHQMKMQEEGAQTCAISLKTAGGLTATRSVSIVIDTSPPVLAFTGGEEPNIKPKNGVVTLAGTVQDRTPCVIEASCRRNSGAEEKQSATVSPDQGTWSFDFKVEGGQTEFEVTARDAAGRVSSLNHIINVDDSAPVLTLSMPRSSGQIVDLRQIRLEGTVSDKSACQISIKATTPSGQVEEKFVTVAAGKNPWNSTFDLSEGRTSFVITATDKTNRRAVKNYVVVVDRTAPTLVVDALPQETEASTLVIRGRASDLNGAVVEINGTQVATDLNGAFSQQQNLRVGSNTFRVRARDNLNHSTLKTVMVTRRDPQPVQVVAQVRTQYDINMRPIKAGSFMMGSPANEKDRGEDEVRHRVVLSRDFFMSATEITRGQWSQIMRNKPWEKFKSNGGLGVGIGFGFGGKARLRPTRERHSNQMAIGHVTYDDARQFCDRLNSEYRFPGWEFRLPTEAEWEYCCRAGRPTAFCFGDSSKDMLKGFGWFEANRRNSRTPMEVGTKRPNQWGLYDMHGNVREWCLDWYGPYNSRGATDPRGPSNGRERITRGGSLKHEHGDCRSANRIANDPNNREFSLGFRIVLAPR